MFYGALESDVPLSLWLQADPGKEPVSEVAFLLCLYFSASRMFDHKMACG